MEPAFTVQLSKNILDHRTEFVFQRFANKWFLLITQYGKIPNLYTVQFDVYRTEGLPLMSVPVHDKERHYSVPVTMKCNFGADNDETRSGIQYLINKTNLHKCPTEILISLGLIEINKNVLQHIASVVETIIA